MRIAAGSLDRLSAARSRLGALAGLLLLACAPLTSTGGGEAPPAEKPAPPQPLRPLFWVRERRLPPVNRVFPHPVDPDLVYVTLDRQLARTRDGGMTWEALEAAGIPGGRITVLAPCPADASVLYAGTPEGGVWRSTDGGDRFSPLGGQDRGLIHPAVVDIRFWETDPTWQSLFVSHGIHAPGLSFTENGGASWRAVAVKDVFGRLVACEGDIIVAEKAPANDRDTWDLGYSYDYGAHWSIVKRDVSPMAGAVTVAKPRQVLWATVDEGVLLGKDCGLTFAQAGPKEPHSWVGVLSTWGTSAAQEVTCAYDPNEMGLVRSTDRMKTWTQDNQGLYVGRFVKEGANVAVNANGAVYYASVNNALYVGRAVPEKDGPVMTGLRCDPPAAIVSEPGLREANETIQRLKNDDKSAEVQAARKVVERSMMNMRVRVEHPGGLAAVKSVTVDLSPLRGDAATRLFDDGKHGDGEAGDGAFAVSLPYTGSWHEIRNNPFSRAALTVTAADVKGIVRTVPIAVAFSPVPQAFMAWHADHAGWWHPKIEGPVSCEAPEKQGKDPKRRGFFIKSKEPKAWSVTFVKGASWNIYGQKTVLIEMRGTVSPSQMFFALYDNLVYMDDANPSKEVPLIGKYAAAIGPDWQIIRVPLEDLLGGTAFKRGHCGGYHLRVPDGVPPGTWQVDNISFEP